MKHFTLLVVLFFIGIQNLLGQAQLGGEDVYEFLNLPASARTTALGGIYFTAFDKDPNLGLQNPALYNKQMHQQLSVGNVFYFDGINFGNVAYVHHFDSLFTIGADVQYVNYGDFVNSNAQGQAIGEFSGGEYLFNIGIAHQQDRVSYGANLKAIQSSIDAYSSFGLAVDVGAVYHNPEKRFIASLVFKNIGAQLSTYADGEKQQLPLDIQLGISKRLQHLPLRLSVHAHHLTAWDIRYDDPSQQVDNSFLGSEDTMQQNYFADKLFRHLIFAGEFYFGKNVQVRFGYNHLQRQELKLDNVAGLLGFSFGAAINIRRFKIEYGRGNYHFSGGTNHLTLIIDLAELGLPKFKKKQE